MKTVETIQQSLSNGREAWFAYRKKLNNNLQTLENLYSKRYEDKTTTPKATIEALIDRIGKEAATEIIATLVNRNAWDGRISKCTAMWAESQENAWNEEAADKLQIYSNSIHCSHLNQLAEELMKY